MLRCSAFTISPSVPYWHLCFLGIEHRLTGPNHALGALIVASSLPHSYTCVLQVLLYFHSADPLALSEHQPWSLTMSGLLPHCLLCRSFTLTGLALTVLVPTSRSWPLQGPKHRVPYRYPLRPPLVPIATPKTLVKTQNAILVPELGIPTARLHPVWSPVSKPCRRESRSALYRLTKAVNMPRDFYSIT